MDRRCSGGRADADLSILIFSALPLDRLAAFLAYHPPLRLYQVELPRAYADFQILSPPSIYGLFVAIPTICRTPPVLKDGCRPCFAYDLDVAYLWATHLSACLIGRIANYHFVIVNPSNWRCLHIIIAVACVIISNVAATAANALDSNLCGREIPV
jgi:hypothetical protein